ncbi:hypothetical protein [Streptomyces aureocirculatus]|uniref:hypothetical protein n=1 Tax=Streptomyces aureocirculatus TaxID=67275 RepID=UPI0007C42EFF|nr:hypothetical protein [Streptomyces aureocirculatus]
MRHVATGDRNAYDRCIFQLFDHRGRALLILGLGDCPNTGVIDAYATLRTGDTLHAVPLDLGVELLTSLPLAVGAGYPPADDWQHGTWRGRGWVDRRTYDLAEPSAHPLAGYGVTDHAARFTLDGRVGHGIFEHGTFGRHDPSGFTGFGSVAP